MDRHAPVGVPPAEEREVRPNFLTEIIDRDLREGKHAQIVTRFPPEPNGYLHLGHAKPICLNFGIARDYGGRCNLRFDDTNPTTESSEYVEAIERDIAWLGFDWGGESLFASDYFKTLYRHAQTLIRAGKAYVDGLSEAEIREYRGTVTRPGQNSPHRERPAEESLELLERMRGGEFAEGAHVLRAKIDMAHPNMVMRDPILYRIRHAHHYRTGDDWHIYPLYDFAHGLSDAIEGVTHSFCSLEFETRRELYDWLVDNLYDSPRPHQYEFGRHAIEYTVLSKRKLIELVKGGYVNGWDDPRMPTLVGLRRRGVTPEAIRDFVDRIGVSRQNSTTSIALLEYSLRDDLNHRAPRVMAVLDPLPLTITNFPEGRLEELEASYWPADVPKEGSRPVPFSRNLLVERADFAEDPPKGWRRLAPGATVRLRYGYVITCHDVTKDEDGRVQELVCTARLDSLGRQPEGVTVSGTIHWLSRDQALPAEFRLYDRLFREADPEASDVPFTSLLNPDSLEVRRGFIEPSIGADAPDVRYQFERQGYFWRDPVDCRGDALVFNRIVTLRDSWAKTQAGRQRAAEAVAAEQATQGRARPAAARSAETRDPTVEFDDEQLDRFRRYQERGLSRPDAALIAEHAVLGRYFEEAAAGADAQSVANWLTNEVWRELKAAPSAELKISPGQLAALVNLVDQGTINTRAAKEVLAVMLATGDDPDRVVAREELEQLSDAGAIAPIVERLVSEHPEKVAAYRAGKVGLQGFFVGQVMRETKGRADPKLVQELVRDKLG